MAVDIDSPQFREIVVTDVDWLFDGGIKESITLHDTDTIVYNKVEGSVDLVIAPRSADEFPEYISYQTNKIIGQRTRQRRMKVTLPDKAWRHPRPTTGASPSGRPPAGPAASSRAGSVSRASGVRVRPSRPPQPARPAPRPPSPRNTPMYDSREQEAVHTFGSWRVVGRSSAEEA